MITWIVTIILIYVVALFAMKYFEEAPKNAPVAAATDLREAAQVHETNMRAAEIRENDAMKTARREAALRKAEEAEFRALLAAADAIEGQRKQFVESEQMRRRTPLIITQANFPSTVTNCVGDRGNSLFLPQ